jgi:uncharacterized damage-inducible protein DinB
MRLIKKPTDVEYAPYAKRYIGLLPDDGLVLEHLRENLKMTCRFLSLLGEEKLLYRYAPDKWTIKEIVLHIADDERIYTYRALRFARNDRTELPGFDQDSYALYSDANQRTLDDLLGELATVRAATLSFFNSLSDEALARVGIADGNVMSVRAIAYHIAGHELRHINIIRERYPAVAPT